MKAWSTRFLTILLVTAAIFSSVNIVQAEPPPDDSGPAEGDDTPISDSECRECHWDVYVGWEQSTHGKGLTCGQCHLGGQDNHAREGHWTQGGPQECMSCHTTGYDPDTDTWEEGSIHCSVCHPAVSSKHPDEPAPTDRTADLCGNCHIEAFFEWQTSAHGEAEVACISCHSQHTTSLKTGDVMEQCSSCHDNVAAGYLKATHYDEGLTCADCHLATFAGPVSAGMAKRNHTFDVQLDTCMVCHSDGLHNIPEDEEKENVLLLVADNNSPDPMATNINTSVSDEPQGVSPFGFVALGSVMTGLGIGGLGFGFITALAIWLHFIIQRARRQKKGVSS